MPNDLAFTLVDIAGNTLHFDSFAYERSIEAARGDWHDANWIRCRITLQTTIKAVHRNTVFRQSVNAELLTTELTELSNALRAVVSAPGAEKAFRPIEPYIRLQLVKLDKLVRITARLDLAPAIGPVVEFTYECRPEEIEATIAGIERVTARFPERNVS